MSYEKIIARHVRRLELFMSDERETMLCIRTGHEGERIAAKMIAKLGDDDGRSLLLAHLTADYVDEASFFQTGADAFVKQVEDNREGLASLGFALGEVEPFVAPRGHASGAAAVAFAEWIERIQRRIDPLVQQVLVLMVPGAAPEAELVAVVAALAGATCSRAIKYVLLESVERPRIREMEVPRRRVLHASQVGEDNKSHEARRSPAERVLLIDRTHLGRWTAAGLYAALAPSLFVKRALSLGDRWTFFGDLEEAADQALDHPVDHRAEPAGSAMPRSNMAARFAEHLEHLAGDGSALVWIDITESASLRLADEQIRALAEAASSSRVRYAIVVDQADVIARLEPARVAVHELRISGKDAVRGYEESLTDPDLSPVDRVRQLCMLAGLVASQPKEQTPAHKSRSIALAREAVERSAELPPLERAVAFFTLGGVLTLDGRYPAARHAFAHATQCALQGGSPPLAATALAQVGIAHARMREWEPAAASFRAAGDAFRRLGQTGQEMQMMVWRGDVELRRDDLEAAASAWLAVIDRAKSPSPLHQLLGQLSGELSAGPSSAISGDPSREAIEGVAAQAHERLAKLHQRAGDPAGAAEHRAHADAHGRHAAAMEPF